MASVTVLYPRSAGFTFDADYYTGVHVPLVEKAWGPHGLTGAEVLWPVDDTQPFVVMVMMRFESQGAVDAAFASPGAAEVMTDVAKFTNIQPALYRAND